MGFRKTAIAGAILAATTGIWALPLSAAQADAPSNPNILAAVQQVQSTLETLVTGLQSLASNLQTTLANLQTSINNLQPATPGNEATSAFLPTFPISGQLGFTCTVTNVAAEPRTVVVALLGADGQPLSMISPFTNALQPGRSSFGGITTANANAVGVGARCRVTVQNGTKRDVIGVLTRDALDAAGAPLSSTSAPLQ